MNGDAPYHYWEFPSGGGQLVEDFGSTPNVLVGISNPPTGYAGVWDGGLACAFNGIGYWVADQSEALVAPVSIECWCWVYSFAGADCILINWAGGGANGCGLHLNAARQPRFAVDNLDIHSAGAVSVQAWHHIVGTYSSGTATLYVDNVQVATIGAGGVLGAADKWSVGGTAGGANRFNGLLASPAVYHSALIAAQIGAHYTAADDKGVFPAFVGAPAGGFGGGIGGIPVDLGTILNSVRKVY